MSKKTIKDAFAALRSRLVATQQEARSHLREFISDAAQAEIAGQEFKLAENEVDTLMGLLEGEGLDASDFEANVTAHAKRLKNAELAAQLPALTAHANKLDREAKEFAQKSYEQHQANLKMLRELELEAAAAIAPVNQATIAESDHMAHGEVSAEERELTKRKALIAQSIAELQDRLSTSRPFWFGSNTAASAVNNPALAIIESEHELKALKRSAAPTAKRSIERLDELARVIAKAREVIPTIEAEIRTLTKDGDKIDARLRELALARPFEILKPRRAHVLA